LPTSIHKIHLRYPLLNPLSRGEGPSLPSFGSQRLTSLAPTRPSPHCYAWFRDGIFWEISHRIWMELFEGSLVSDKSQILSFNLLHLSQSIAKFMLL
jgi:hypothetical protein